MPCRIPKRMNFNMDEECAQVLKAVAALKGITISEHINNCLMDYFCKAIYEDIQIQQMFLNGTYNEHGKAYALQAELKKSLDEKATV